MQNEAHFSGPDDPPGKLRDLLADRIRQVPPGGSVDLVAYYFRDRRLAEDLLKAKSRGVEVRLTLDGHPRSPHANDAVLAMLAGEERKGGILRVSRSRADPGLLRKVWRPRLHAKLYCFSHPEPVAFVGSFNPSGDVPEQMPELVRDLGDHDRGFNTLVELREPGIAHALAARARAIHRERHGPLDRFRPSSNRGLNSRDLEIHFWPRVLPSPVRRLLNDLPRGSRVRVAASHVSGNSVVRVFGDLARRGVDVAMLTHHTLRRVPAEVERAIAGAGISIRQVQTADELPMHDKFALIERGADRKVVFGSLNWSARSQQWNREIAVIASDPVLVDAFESRWRVLEAVAEESEQRAHDASVR